MLNRFQLLPISLFIALWDETSALGVTSRLQVHIPKSLSRDGGYEHREALFGVPPYGGSIQQTVYYADQTLCQSTVDTTIGFPERKPDSDGVIPSWPAPYILMVDRGGCTFVQKVRNAQRSGAAGVIIADSKCLCSFEDVCTPEAGQNFCENEEPVMADDGSGSDISIPSFLMFKQDADPLREALKNNQAVRVEMAWKLPSTNNAVEYDLFTTPTDQVSRHFQDQFRTAAVALGEHAKFTPHMYIYDGIIAGCQGFDGENECGDMCTNNGRYCATEPDGFYGITGADIVKESLRRACIWSVYGGDGVGLEWWTYVEEFLFRCNTADYFSSEDCLKDVYTNSNVDAKQVEECMLDSGGLDDDEANTLLESQLAEREVSGAVIIPSMFVNGATIRGALTFSTIFKAVCAGFEVDKEPKVCKMCANCNDEFHCVTDGICKTGGPDAPPSVSVPLFGVSLLVIVFFFGCIGAIQYQRSQNQMREQVKGIMAEYMPLDKKSANLDTSVGLEDTDGEFS